MTAYYNEIDPYAAQWLRNLIAAGHIAAGDVDERSITDVRPDDLAGYTQCHFFAGIGVWSHALRLVQWPDTRPVWTGSCPCQPFSVAGASAGVRDERHLWPHWFWLIEQCRPAVVFGEQVEAAIGHGWLDLVQADLEGLDYAVGHAGIPAAGVGAPHIRQRLWFVADANSLRREGLQRESSGGLDRGNDQQRALLGLGSSGEAGGVADATNERQHGRRASEACDGRDAARVEPQRLCDAGRLANTEGPRPPHRGAGAIQPIAPQTDRNAACGVADAQHNGCGGQESHQAKPNGNREDFGLLDRGRFAPQGQPATGPAHSFWRAADWLLCRDGKWRPVEPGTFPLAHGAPARVGRLRAYGNAIVPQVAAEVISAFMECRP